MKKSISAPIRNLSSTLKIFVLCFLFFLVMKVIKKD